jgi:cytochrome oxidase Cu insertion factor (SCO1/SenC/PrrC family)
MNSGPAPNARNKPRFILALAGLLLVLLSPALWALTLDVNFLQRTALPMWVTMAFGLACTVLAALWDVRKRTRIVALLCTVLVVLSVPGYLVLTRLPTPTGFATANRVPDFTLTDHLGRETTLSGLVDGGSLLLVFYRGHW